MIYDTAMAFFNGIMGILTFFVLTRGYTRFVELERRVEALEKAFAKPFGDKVESTALDLGVSGPNCS